ncbi:hypothetical protein [Planobispora takensis]|uniref:Uncharacterized protein n=1 Tax=Planobispora takensis TaxID=1367882 RepID=A0A8J3T768_9ACTN|nr:hypothetical protein [Planobispora takensis]GII05475.1 hypothetical protein Pta02_74830 [Planobispora takensis]
MRHNERPVLLASTMAPNLLSLHPDERPMAVCTDCGAWRILRRNMLWPHRAADGVSRCPGSGQRIVLDLTPAEWLSSLSVACRDAAGRRARRTFSKPEPPAPPPLHRMAA